MRKKNSIKNMIASLGGNIITIIIGVIAQALFIKVLGSEFLGLNSLFNNVISMLSIIEMGIGSAIIYNLYKPIADEDTEQINSLMRFYKKSYRIIALIVTILGLIIIPFIKYIVDIDSITVNINVYYVYLLFLADIVASYFLSYKRSILYANQKNYIINIIHILYTISVNVLQIIMLYLTENYYLYLVVKILMRIVENIVITFIANKTYSYLKTKNVKKLNKGIEKDIFKKVRALFSHRIGGFVVLGTDNIIISKFLGIVTVGLYSNYYMVVNALQTVIDSFIRSTTASIGNMLVTEKKEKQFDIFKKIRFLNFWITSLAGIGLIVVMTSFVNVWLGGDFILSFYVLLAMVINFYFYSTRSTYLAFKDAAGIYYEDRFIPLIEAVINIIASIVFVKLFGLAGVILGTITSVLFLYIFSYSKYVYMKLFDKSYFQYMRETILYFVLFIIVGTFTYFSAYFISIDNSIIDLIVRIIIALVIPNIIFIFIFNNNDNFVYYKNMLKTKFKRGEK